MYIYLIVSIIFMVYVIDMIVSFLNFKNRNKPIPKSVEHIYDETAYQKWLAYNMEQTRFGFFSKTFHTVLLIVFFLTGVFKLFASWSADIFQSEILGNLMFLLFYFVISTLVNIPFGYYETFKIEETYGFNKTTKKTFVKDIIKNFILTAFLFGGIVSALNGLLIAFRDHLWIFIGGAWFVLIGVVTILFVLNTKVFVKVFNKLTPLEEGSLRNRIEALSTKVGFEVKAISIMDASRRTTKLNAFFSGLGKTREVVLFDTLVEKMSEDEVLAVLAHELGHAKHKDTLKMLGERAVLFALLAVILGFTLSTQGLYTDFGIPFGHLGFGFIVFGSLIEPIGMLVGILTNYLSRVAEYRADAYAAKMTDKKHMISALVLLARENFSNLNPHRAYELLYYDHPKMSDRIESLNALEENNEL